MNRRPLRLMPALTAGVGMLLAATLAVAAPPPGFVLKLDAGLSEARAPMQGLPAFGRAWTVEGRTEDQTTLIGDAEIRRAGSVIRGDRITYTSSTDELTATGNVRVTREGNVFTGPALKLRIDANEGTFTSPDYYLALQGGGRGHAERVDFLGPGRVFASRASFTTCGPETPDWQLSTRTLYIDQDADQGTSRNALLTFKGTPILASPYFGFSLGNERKSGLLTPTFSVTTRSGVDLMVPLYLNLSHDTDATLYPRMSTRRGAQLGGEFRYLRSGFSGETRFESNPYDQETGTSRHFWHTRHSFSDLAGWAGGWDMRGVSDDRYFVDYSRSIVTSADRVLPRTLSFGRSLGEDWSTTVSVQKFQSILDARPGPYDREPQVTARWLARDRSGFDFNGLFDVTQFRAPDAIRASGTRMVANPSASWPIRRPGWFVVPKASVHLSSYQINEVNGTDYRLDRWVPTWSMDSGLVFERPFSYAGREITQTLEPRLFYVRTPFRPQGNFPVFDTAPADFNFSQLFSENTFIGNDRIADVNQLTAAAVSRLIDPASGSEGIRVATGFRSYFSDQQVAIPGVAPRTDRRSDLLLAAAGPLGAHWTFDTGLQYSMATSEMPRFSAVGRYLPPDGRVLNAGVRYRRDQLGQVDVSTRWPVSDGWNSLVRLNYSFLAEGFDPVSGVQNSRGFVETLFGFEYGASCWALRLLTQQFRTAANASTTAFFVQLELNGFGTIGQNPFLVLQRNIPGYRLPSGSLEPGSRYVGYE